MLKRVVMLATVAVVTMLMMPTPAQAAAGHNFWVRCLPTIEERRADPIAAFGRRSAHAHVFFGTRVGRTTTGDELRERRRTNCSARTDFSGYWIPTFRGPAGHLITPDDIVVYYRNADPTRRVVPFPSDLARISQDVFYSCGRGTPTSAEFRRCPAPTTPRMIVQFRPDPSIGDRNFPEVRIGVRWTSHPGTNPSRWVASSDRMGPRHGDFMNGWLRGDLRQLLDACLNDPTPKKSACGKVSGREP